MSSMLWEVTWCKYKIGVLLIHFVCNNECVVLAVVAWGMVGAQVTIVRFLISYFIVTTTFQIHTDISICNFKYMISKFVFSPSHDILQVAKSLETHVWEM